MIKFAPLVTGRRTVEAEVSKERVHGLLPGLLLDPDLVELPDARHRHPGLLRELRRHALHEEAVGADAAAQDDVVRRPALRGEPRAGQRDLLRGQLRRPTAQLRSSAQNGSSRKLLLDEVEEGEKDEERGGGMSGSVPLHLGEGGDEVRPAQAPRVGLRRPLEWLVL